MKLHQFIRLPLRRMQREDGSATIEAVLWMPVLIAVFALIADTSMIFGNEAQVLRVVQDANRKMSIGRLLTPESVQTEVKSKIALVSPNAVVTTTVTNGLIKTSVSLPLSDITSTGLVSAFANVSFTVSAEHLMEG